MVIDNVKLIAAHFVMIFFFGEGIAKLKQLLPVNQLRVVSPVRMLVSEHLISSGVRCRVREASGKLWC